MILWHIFVTNTHECYIQKYSKPYTSKLLLWMVGKMKQILHSDWLLDHVLFVIKYGFEKK